MTTSATVQQLSNESATTIEEAFSLLAPLPEGTAFEPHATGVLIKEAALVEAMVAVGFQYGGDENACEALIEIDRKECQEQLREYVKRDAARIVRSDVLGYYCRAKAS